jgi:hypothetical protein
MLYLTNAFSLNMFSLMGAPARMEIMPVDSSEVLETLEHHGPWCSAVGHADTAAVFSSEIGIEIPCQRTTVSLAQGDALLVGQYIGPRLPEGATALPEGATIRWLLVTQHQFEDWQAWEDAVPFARSVRGDTVWDVPA